MASLEPEAEVQVGPEAEEEDEYEEDYEEQVEAGNLEELEENGEPADVQVMAELVGLDSEPASQSLIDLPNESYLTLTDTAIQSSPYLTQFELTKVRALRAQQLAEGAPPCIPASVFADGEYPLDTIQIVDEELRQQRLPFMIIRSFPNGKALRIPVSSLNIP
jgi:DNA-directed RNA polymerase subunit K/omega